MPPSFPRHTLALLHLTLAVADLLAILRHGRTFRLLAPGRREALLQSMATHRMNWLRRLVQWWKLVALVTR